jgi:hypothetical protein
MKTYTVVDQLAHELFFFLCTSPIHENGTQIGMLCDLREGPVDSMVLERQRPRMVAGCSRAKMRSRAGQAKRTAWQCWHGNKSRFQFRNPCAVRPAIGSCSSLSIQYSHLTQKPDNLVVSYPVLVDLLVDGGFSKCHRFTPN